MAITTISQWDKVEVEELGHYPFYYWETIGVWDYSKNIAKKYISYIFNWNQHIYERLGYFPLLWWRQTFANIAGCILQNLVSPLPWSFKMSYSWKGCAMGQDFEVRCNFRGREVWLKADVLPYFISKDTKGIGYYDIKRDYLQVLHFAFARALEIRARDKQSSKIILLVIPVRCYAEEFDELLASGELDNVPHIVCSHLKSEYQSINDKRRKKLRGGIYLQAFDFRKYINEDRSKEDMPSREESPKNRFLIPYAILAGIVIG